MSLYELTESAATDLRDIIAYLAEHAGEATASRIEDELFAKFESLAANSGQGHVRSDLTTFPLVFFPIGPFLIVYQRESAHPYSCCLSRGAGREATSQASRR
jgi:plasmid stabilization system protein ParE